MADIRLTKSELAALDFMIAEMEGGAAPSSEAVMFTPAIARTAWAVTRIAIRYTPAILEAIGATAATEHGLSELREMSSDLAEAPSLEDLIQLRKRARGG